MTAHILTCLMVDLSRRPRARADAMTAHDTDPHDRYCTCDDCAYADAAEADMWDTYWRRYH